jgi:hypothetical protein
MAERGIVDCYVYAIKAGGHIIYIGKGVGRRAQVSARRCCGKAEILKSFTKEDAAFAYEREMIALHKPAMNICAGGKGGRAAPKPIPRKPKWMAEIERIGSRVYAARFLLTRLDEGNCEQWGVSKLDLSKLRSVANGCGA